MKNLQFSGNLFGEWITLKQVSKTTAKKLFCAGETIYLQSSNFHPFGVWPHAFDIRAYELDENNNQIFYPYPGDKFNEIVDSFRNYNCSNEQGRYVHFYKSI